MEANPEDQGLRADISRRYAQPMKAVFPILGALALAACATPQQQCVTNATRDLQVVDSLIVETTQNIQRGYAIREDVVPSSGFNWCFGNYGYNSGVSLCSNNTTRIRRTPVAINPQAEQEKLESLQAQRVTLATRSQEQLAACQAQFGS